MSDKGYETPIMSMSDNMRLPLCLQISLTIKFNYENVYKMSDKGYETPLCLQISLTIKCLTMRLPLCLSLTIKCLTRDMRLHYVYKYL